MKTEILLPCCSEKYHDCAACENGFCKCLEDTQFPGNRCPFYKEKSKAQKDEVNSLCTLLRRGRFDLIRRYKSARRLNKNYEEKWI